MPKYIDFQQSGESANGKPEWFVHNKASRNVIGRCVWYPPWRQWVFEALPNTVWSNGCLRDVAEWLEQHNKGG